MSTFEQKTRIGLGVVECAAIAHFDYVAVSFATLSSERQAMLGVLLGVTVPEVPAHMSSLRPIWANEAMQRAYDLVALFGMLDGCGASLLGLDGEWRIVSHLARIYSSLVISDGKMVQTCSTDLRDVVRNLTELFAPIAENITLYTMIEHLSLRPLERRALVLIAAKLVVDAIRRASGSDRAVCLTVALVAEWPRAASLYVTMETGDRTDFGNPVNDDVVDDLAALLECDPDIFETAFGVQTELRFPLNAVPRI